MDLYSVPVPNLSLAVKSAEPLDVRSFSVDERLSRLFDIEIVAMSRNPDIALDAIVGEPASFQVQGDGVRTWTGVIRHVELEAAEPNGLSRYRLLLAPDAWLLSQRRNYRLFQNRSELDCALLVLREAGISPLVRVDGATLPSRELRTQYGESDLDFVSRMLEQAGITYYFELGDDGATHMVLDDAPQRRKPGAPIDFVDSVEQSPRGRWVTALHVIRKVRPGRYTLKDYDQRLAADFDLGATVGAKGVTSTEARLERYHYVPGSCLAAGRGAGTPVADDRGSFRSSTDEAASIAQRRLEAQRADALSVTFEARATKLMPGVVTRVLHHPHSAIGAEVPLLIVHQRLTGTSTGDWKQHCEASPATSPYRPALATPRPVVQGIETATIVGPAGDEIHVDELGRVRVHFHWDREGRFDEGDSCWLHVSQAWAGTGFGGVNLPRVGQEVVVEFLSGNPDRPMVTGRVYTATQPVPFTLPGNKTQSGWKSSSTGGTGGFNEIMFEDRAGDELFRIRAERDMETLVRHDERRTVENDRSTLIMRDELQEVARDRRTFVGVDQQNEVGRDRSTRVGNDNQLAIGGSDSQVVGRDRDVVIDRNESTTVRADKSLVVMGNASTTVKGDEEHIVDGKRHVAIGRDDELVVSGNLATSVSKNRRDTTSKGHSSSVGTTRSAMVGLSDSLTVGASKSTTVGLKDSLTVGLSRSVTVGMSHTVSAGMSQTLSVGMGALVPIGSAGASLAMKPDEIVLSTSGGATIRLSGNTITLEAEDISLLAKKKIECSSKVALDLATDKLSIQAKKTAALKAGKNLDISGSLVQINGPGLPAARFSDGAVQEVTNGSSSVHIGGKKMPLGAKKLKNGDLKIGKAITVRGEPKFQAAVVARIGAAGATDNGLKTLKSIDTSGRSVLIVEKAGVLRAGPVDSPGAIVAATAKGVIVSNSRGQYDPMNPIFGTGEGADAVIEFDPSKTIVNAAAPDSPVPSDAILLHELGHADHITHGLWDQTADPIFDTLDERYAITQLENPYYAEIGYPWIRTDHAGTFIPRPAEDVGSHGK